ncbi:MAG: hypothetical protein ACJAXA_000112 [Candidatus Aldehydirespiratoraceae bacterium]|jgi:hypothetical protein
MAALAAVAVGVTVADGSGPASTIAPTSAPVDTSLAPIDTSLREAVSTDDSAFITSSAANEPEIAPAERAPETAVSAGGDAPAALSRRDDFEIDAAGWSSMTGSWVIADGKYTQTDSTGYDFISQYDELPPSEFSISVEMTAIDSKFGGGVVLGQAVLGSRRGATLIDFTDSGMFLRWGLYRLDTGAHEYQGGLAMPDDFDPTLPHTLTVEASAARTIVIVDGERIADFAAIVPGYVGLSTSVSSIAFDNVDIVSL